MRVNSVGGRLRLSIAERDLSLLIQTAAYEGKQCWREVEALTPRCSSALLSVI